MAIVKFFFELQHLDDDEVLSFEEDPYLRILHAN